jgi:hypothetical protein
VSADLLVFLKRSSMPSPASWAEAITQASLPVDMDPDFDVVNSSGFRPCRFRGELSGFEYYSSDLTAEDREEYGLPAGFDFCVNLLAHSDYQEWETAAAAAGVLCFMSRGVLVDLQSGEECSTNEVLAWVGRQLGL